METIKYKNKEYQVIEKLPNKKLRVKRGHSEYTIVPFDNLDNLKKYLTNKKIIKRNKVEAPKIISVDKQGLMILEQFIVGENLMSVIALNRLIDRDYVELFRIYRNNRFAKILLSYKPENFIKHGKYFYYVSDVILPSNQGIAFERGEEIELWINTPRQKRYIESKGYPYFSRMLITNSGELKKKIALLCTAFW